MRSLKHFSVESRDKSRELKILSSEHSIGGSQSRWDRIYIIYKYIRSCTAEKKHAKEKEVAEINQRRRLPIACSKARIEALSAGIERIILHGERPRRALLQLSLSLHTHREGGIYIDIARIMPLVKNQSAGPPASKCTFNELGGCSSAHHTLN